MVRYGNEHKRATRQRILEVAGRRFKRDGIDGAGVAAVMADADLTNGAFYAHFASKEDLVACTVADQLRAQAESFAVRGAEGGGPEQFVRSYLSARHRDNPQDGCPSAALLDEITRRGDSTRRAYTEGLLAVMDAIVARRAAGWAAGTRPTEDRQAARVKALAVFAAMVGTLQLSRALDDPELADEVLEQGVRNVLALMGADRQL
ncbi:MAG TPA: TetR/AcrR family transcriptional regulator [Trebonia sp.]|nr:TetR/AcrR family transcriptional regulator [Trebonia sp.]